MLDFPGLRAFSLGAILVAGMMLLSATSLTLGRGHPALPASMVLGTGLFALSVIDIDRGLLPNWLTLPLIVLGIFYSWLSGGNIVLSGIGAVVGYAIVWLLAEYWRRARGVEGIGLGDAKLLSAGGAWAGVFALPGILLIASTLGIVSSFLSSGRVESKQSIRFGPFLAIGIWAMWVFPLH